MADLSRPLQSAGVDGITILRPGTWKNSASTLCEWYRPPCTPAPEDAAVHAKVLPQHDNARVTLHLFVERLVDSLDQRLQRHDAPVAQDGARGIEDGSTPPVDRPDDEVAPTPSPSPVREGGEPDA